jgi:hypothetical protein
MSNRILHVEVKDRSVVPAEAELRVTVVPERIDERTEVRGRLMGPRCRFASTVEVAYHMRRLPVTEAGSGFVFKVIIPEASSWEPESPHLYVGPIELWQDGVRADVVTLRYGLRRVSLGPRGLRVNGRPLTLRGRELTSLDEAEALSLREFGYNSLLVPVSEGSRHVWDVADQIGFFVLGKVGQGSDAALTGELARYSSCLGWLSVGDESTVGLVNAPLMGIASGTFRQDRASFAADFVAIPPGEALTDDRGLPVLLLGGGAEHEQEGGRVVLGVVER